MKVWKPWYSDFFHDALMNSKLEKQHLLEIEIFRNIIKVLAFFYQFNVSLLNKSINFLKTKKEAQWTSVYLPVTHAHFKMQYDIEYKCLSMIIKLFQDGVTLNSTETMHFQTKYKRTV